jgi:ferredoxin
MKIIVDCDRCQGHALCAAQAPDVYELDEQGYNSMGEFTVKPGQEDAAIEGANWCPEEAITIVE